MQGREKAPHQPVSGDFEAIGHDEANGSYLLERLICWVAGPPFNLA
jgi:hypothetical protein